MSDSALTTEELATFSRLRALTFEGIKRALEDGGGKSYEGRFEIHFPDYFDGAAFSLIHDNVPWAIRLHCYVLGPSRHYEWTGKTFMECIEAAVRDVTAWVKEAHDG